MHGIFLDMRVLQLQSDTACIVPSCNRLRPAPFHSSLQAPNSRRQMLGILIADKS